MTKHLDAICYACPLILAACCICLLLACIFEVIP